MSFSHNASAETLDQLIEACQRAVSALACAPSNDPQAFEKVDDALDMVGVRTRRDPEVPQWAEGVSVEDKLKEIIEILPLVPAHAPSRLRELGRSVKDLLLEDLSPVEEERAGDAIRDYVLSGGIQSLGDAALAYLVDLSALSDDFFPNGLVPPPPAWPTEVTTVLRGEPLANVAFSELHLQGWATAARNFHLEGARSLAGAEAARDAKIAFAECAVGPAAAAKPLRGWRTHVLYQLGPKFAEELLGPATSWSDAEDFTYANNIAKRYITNDDWDSADRVTQDMLNWHGEADQHEMSLLDLKLRRIAKKKYGAAPPRSVTTRPKGSRPFRRPAAPSAPPRPEAATRVLLGASTEVERQFVAALTGGEPQRSVVAMHDLPNGGSSAHLWLLFELDNQWVNGQILKHPAVDAELRTGILRQARHGKNPRPGLSGYVDLMAGQRFEFAHEVLLHCDDDAVIVTALRGHRDLFPPGTAIALAKRTLRMPAAPAIAILDTIFEQFANRLPDDVRQLLDAARLSATMDQLPAAHLEAAFDEASARFPDDITTVTPDQSANDLISRLADANDTSTVEQELHRWRGDLPWDELGAATDGGRFTRPVVERLVRRSDAPNEILLGAIRRGQLPRTNSAGETRRWLDAVLSAAGAIDDRELGQVRINLATSLILDDPNELRRELAEDEWRAAATRALLIRLGAVPVGFRPNLDRVEPRALELGGEWIRDGRVNVNHIIGVIPLPIACRLWFAAYPDDDSAPAPNAAGERIPKALHDWIEDRLAEPGRGFSPSVVDAVRAAVPTWSESLRDLLGLGEELQDEARID